MTNNLMRYRIVLLGAFSSLWLSMYAQSPQELFAFARENNAELKALRLEYEAELERVPQTGLLPHPELSAGAFVLPVETRLGAQQARLSVMQMFPWFGTNERKKSQVFSHAQAQQERIAARELEVFYQIRLKYYQCYEFHASSKILERNLELLYALKRLAETRVAAGTASLVEVLRVDLQLQAIMQQLEILQQKKKMPEAAINQLLNRQLNTPIALPDSLPLAAIAMEKDRLLADILSSHPLLQQLSLQQETSRLAIEVNKKSSQPSFGLGMDYLSVQPRSDAFPQSNGRDIIQLKAAVIIPLYRERYAAKKREEQLRIEAMESRKQEVYSQFASQVEQTFAAYESTILQHQLYLRQIATVESALEIMLADYSSHGKGLDELLRLETERFELELKLLSAIVQSHVAKANMERYGT